MKFEIQIISWGFPVFSYFFDNCALLLRGDENCALLLRKYEKTGKPLLSENKET
jgi:hypothetical protein